jgi:hypothetical protein
MYVQETDREVSAEDGRSFAKAHGCLFVETSAKADVAVTQAFEELVLKVLTMAIKLSVRQLVRLHACQALQTPFASDHLHTDALPASR